MAKTVGKYSGLTIKQMYNISPTPFGKPPTTRIAPGALTYGRGSSKWYGPTHVSYPSDSAPVGAAGGGYAGPGSFGRTPTTDFQHQQLQQAQTLESQKTQATKQVLSAQQAGESLYSKSKVAFSRLEETKSRIESLQKQARVASMTGNVDKGRRLNIQANRLVAEFKLALGKANSLQDRAFEKFGQAQSISASEGVGVVVHQPQEKLVESIPLVGISPLDLPEGRRFATPQEQGLLFSAGIPASGEAKEAFYKGTGYPEVSYSREPLEAAGRESLAMTATGVAVATLPVSATAAYGGGGLLGLAKFGGEILGGIVGSEIVRTQAPPLLEAVIPGKEPEVYKTGGEALSFTGFVVGAKAASSSVNLVVNAAKNLGFGKPTVKSQTFFLEKAEPLRATSFGEKQGFTKTPFLEKVKFYKQVSQADAKAGAEMLSLPEPGKSPTLPVGVKATRLGAKAGKPDALSTVFVSGTRTVAKPRLKSVFKDIGEVKALGAGKGKVQAVSDLLLFKKLKPGEVPLIPTKFAGKQYKVGFPRVSTKTSTFLVESIPKAGKSDFFFIETAKAGKQYLTKGYALTGKAKGTQFFDIAEGISLPKAKAETMLLGTGTQKLLEAKEFGGFTVPKTETLRLAGLGIAPAPPSLKTFPKTPFDKAATKALSGIEKPQPPTFGAIPGSYRELSTGLGRMKTIQVARPVGKQKPWSIEVGGKRLVMEPSKPMFAEPKKTPIQKMFEKTVPVGPKLGTFSETRHLASLRASFRGGERDKAMEKNALSALSLGGKRADRAVKRGQRGAQAWALNSLGIEATKRKQREAVLDASAFHFADATTLRQAELPREITQTRERQRMAEKEFEPFKDIVGWPWVPKARKGKTVKNWANDALGFKVSVRRKGKFRELKGPALTKQSAMRLGALQVERSLARSFRLTPVGGKGMTLDLPPVKFERLRKRKGKSKLPSDVYVEKSKYALSTPSELLEIKAARRTKLKGKKKKKKRRRRK